MRTRSDATWYDSIVRSLRVVLGISVLGAAVGCSWLVSSAGISDGPGPDSGADVELDSNVGDAELDVRDASTDRGCGAYLFCESFDEKIDSSFIPPWSSNGVPSGNLTLQRTTKLAVSSPHSLLLTIPPSNTDGGASRSAFLKQTFTNLPYLAIELKLHIDATDASTVEYDPVQIKFQSLDGGPASNVVELTIRPADGIQGWSQHAPPLPANDISPIQLPVQPATFATYLITFTPRDGGLGAAAFTNGVQTGSGEVPLATLDSVELRVGGAFVSGASTGTFAVYIDDVYVRDQP